MPSNVNVQRLMELLDPNSPRSGGKGAPIGELDDLEKGMVRGELDAMPLNQRASLHRMTNYDMLDPEHQALFPQAGGAAALGPSAIPGVQGPPTAFGTKTPISPSGQAPLDMAKDPMEMLRVALLQRRGRVDDRPVRQ